MRPVDLFFSFRAKDFLPRPTIQNHQFITDATRNIASRRWQHCKRMRTLQQSFKPGDRVLLKATHGGKFNLPGEEVEVVGTA